MVLVRRFKVQVTSYIFDFPLDLYIKFSNRCLWVLVGVCNLGIGFYKSFAPFMISYEFIWCTLILFGSLILISWEHVFFHWIQSLDSDFSDFQNLRISCWTILMKSRFLGIRLWWLFSRNTEFVWRSFSYFKWGSPGFDYPFSSTGFKDWFYVISNF